MLSRRSMVFLARFVLAWFVLHVGAGVAAPMVNPQALQVVCAGSGLKLVPGDDGQAQVVRSGLDCPLCSPALAPPPTPAAAPLLPSAPPPAAVQPQPFVPPSNQAPPPARGPPASAFA